MDWENERYVRVYVRDTRDLVAVGWDGRAVLWELMRKGDRAGVIEGGSETEVLAEILRMPVDVVEPGLRKLIERNVVELHGDMLVVKNFLEAQEAKQSDKQRQRESRARRRDVARAGHVASQKATMCTDESHDVTGSHTVRSQVVTECSDAVTICDESVTPRHSVSPRAKPSRAEPSLAKPSESHAPARVYGSAPVDMRLGQLGDWSSLDDQARQTLAAHADDAFALWAEQERLRAKLKLAPMRPMARKLAAIASRLAEGHTRAECERALAAAAAEVRRDPKHGQWFNGSSNWSAASFDVKLGASQAAATPARKHPDRLIVGSDEWRRAAGLSAPEGPQ